MRPNGITKNDAEAKEMWTPALYEAIPKSVFALLAWHIANRCSGNADNPGAAFLEICTELEALMWSGILPDSQGKPIFKKVRAETDKLLATSDWHK